MSVGLCTCSRVAILRLFDYNVKQYYNNAWRLVKHFLAKLFIITGCTTLLEDFSYMLQFANSSSIRAVIIRPKM